MLVSQRRLLEWNPSAARRTGPSPPRRTAPALRACGVGQVDVDRPGHRRGNSDPVDGIAPSALAVAAPILVLWFVSPGIAWWISRPLARREARLTTGPDALPPQARAKDLGVLRDVRRPGRPLAAAGQLPGTSGRRRRASHVADEHGTCAAGESDGLRLRLHPGRTTPPAHGECA